MNITGKTQDTTIVKYAIMHTETKQPCYHQKKILQQSETLLHLKAAKNAPVRLQMYLPLSHS